MRGKYYLKHTINHTVDNRLRINDLNNNYKLELKKNAIEYLKSTVDPMEKKVDYLKGLTLDVYRYGRKYKYNCNLNSADISNIIKSVGDNELYKAFFNKTIQDDEKQGLYSVIIFIVVIFFIIIALNSCS